MVLGLLMVLNQKTKKGIPVLSEVIGLLTKGQLCSSDEVCAWNTVVLSEEIHLLNQSVTVHLGQSVCGGHGSPE